MTVAGRPSQAERRRPADCEFRDDVLANLDKDAPIAQWSRGFMQGHQWLEESWDTYVPDALDDEFAHAGVPVVACEARVDLDLFTNGVDAVVVDHPSEMCRAIVRVREASALQAPLP